MPKDKPYTRPKDWSKKSKRSHYDSSKAYDEMTDDEKKEAAEKEREEKAEKAGKGKFGKLFKRIIGG